MVDRKILDNAYTEAVKGITETLLRNHTSWYGYVMALPKHLQIVYLVGILDMQVVNGGFDQYFCNLYGIFAKETIDALVTIEAYRKADALNQAYKLVNRLNDSPEVFRAKLWNKEVTVLYDDKLELPKILDKLDTQYYDSDEVEDLEEIIIQYLRQFYTN